MSNNGKAFYNSTGTRFITTKTGTHIIWYDAVSGKQRRVNLSKAFCMQYYYRSIAR